MSVWPFFMNNPSPKLSFREKIWKVEINDIAICALRFDGYKYGEQNSVSISDLYDRFLKDCRPFDNILDNFAVFFILQRMRRNAGELEPITNRAWKAYTLLFLHLYDKEAPEPYRREDYCRQWQTDHLPNINESVALVKKCHAQLGTFERNIKGYVDVLINEYGALEIYNPDNMSEIVCRYYMDRSNQPPYIAEINNMTKQLKVRDLSIDELDNIKSGTGVHPAVFEYFKFLGLGLYLKLCVKLRCKNDKR